MNRKEAMRYNRYKDAYKADVSRMEIQQIKNQLAALRFTARQMESSFQLFFNKMTSLVAEYRPGTLELHAKILEQEAIINIEREQLDRYKIDCEILQESAHAVVGAPEVDLTPSERVTSLESTIRDIEIETELEISSRTATMSKSANVAVATSDKWAQCDILNETLGDSLVLQLRNDIAQLESMYEEQKLLNVELQQQVDSADSPGELTQNYMALDRRNVMILSEMRSVIERLAERDEREEERIVELRQSSSCNVGQYELMTLEGEIGSLKNAIGRIKDVLGEYYRAFSLAEPASTPKSERLTLSESQELDLHLENGSVVML